MFARHRQRLFERLRERRAAAVVPTGGLRTRNNDCEYRFRPHSDFWYLTGFAEPEAVLVLLPGPSAEDDRSVLFLRERDPEMEIWYGRRLGVDKAPAALGVDEAHPIGELWDHMAELLTGYPSILYRLGEDPAFDRDMGECVALLRRKARRSVLPPAELVDPLPLLHELRLFKDADELAVMRRAAEITTEAHVAAMARAAHGVGEWEIEALIEGTFRARGGTGAAYTSIVAGGENACILHYIENDRPLRDGDLLLIDAGCEFDWYASDVTRTFPVSGTFSAEQRALYEVVLHAQKKGLEASRPGNTLAGIHELVVHELTAGLVELGLLSGKVDDLVGSGAFRRFYMHGTGHWLGLDVHDCGAQATAEGPRLLEPGMVFTVEPGLYVAPDEEGVDERWRGLGVRIEDDVLITADGHENLTAAVPKEIDEVEAACRGERLVPARA